MILPTAGQGNANMWKLITHNCLIFSLFNLFEIENTGQIAGVTMDGLKRNSYFVSNIICSSLAHFFTLPSGRCLAKTWESCRLSKAEEKMVAQATVLSQIFSSMVGGVPFFLFWIIHWMVVSLLFVYMAFIPCFSMQNACSLSHLCLILCVLSSISMCKLSSHQSSFFSSLCAYWLVRPYLAQTPANSQILLFCTEIRCPWPEPAISKDTCFCKAASWFHGLEEP